MQVAGAARQFAVHLATVMQQLPSELVVFILQQVGFPSILRCYRVCKRWNYLLNSSDYVLWSSWFPTLIPTAGKNYGTLQLKEVMKFLFKDGAFQKSPQQVFLDCPYNPHQHTRSSWDNYGRLFRCYNRHPNAFEAFCGVYVVWSGRQLLRQRVKCGLQSFDHMTITMIRMGILSLVLSMVFTVWSTKRTIRIHGG